MTSSEGRSSRSAPRWIFLLSAASILLGCGVISFVPVDESRFSSAALRFTSSHAAYQSGDVIFSHAGDAHAAEPCALCHFGTASEETTGVPRPKTQPPQPSLAPGKKASLRPPRRGARLPEPPPPMPEAHSVELPSMALCLRCHDGQTASRDCITCHLTSRKDGKPAFHDGVFPRHHGEMAEREAYKCSLCHQEEQCNACHAERKPLSHTPRFERSTHGRLATHDRRACATCHETSFCENCHSQPPPDHTAAFVSGGGHKQAALVRARSCTVCHRFEDVCAECHQR